MLRRERADRKTSADTRTTQFDIEYDEDAQYRIGILASKIQSSPDIGIVCVTNC